MPSQTTLLCISLLLLLIGLLAGRRYLIGSLSSQLVQNTEDIHQDILAVSTVTNTTNSDSSLPVRVQGQLTGSTNLNNTKLKPAEIAYLMRGGDVTHTLIVVAVDLIQRAVKNLPEGSFIDGLSDYEKNMWRIVSRSVKDWAKDKAQQTVLGGARNPVQIARRLLFVFNFVRTSLRSMVADMISDPKRLKKYFSPQGLIRIVADFSSAGYKQAFRQELRKNLLQRGLLVPEPIRQEAGKRFLLIGFLGIAATFAVSQIFLAPWAIAFIIWLLTLVAGSAARVILSLRSLIPFYEELAQVADQIRRKSFRLTILKVLLRSVTGILWLTIILAVFIVDGIAFGITSLFSSAGTTEIVSIITLTIAHFAIADFMFTGLNLKIEERPSESARRELEAITKQLEHLSPLDSFSKVLNSPDYDPTFSTLLAIYGVETLFILI